MKGNPSYKTTPTIRNQEGRRLMSSVSEVLGVLESSHWELPVMQPTESMSCRKTRERFWKRRQRSLVTPTPL